MTALIRVHKILCVDECTRSIELVEQPGRRLFHLLFNQAPNAPSIVCMAPVTKLASGPASQATMPATSSGRP